MINAAILASPDPQVWQLVALAQNSAPSSAEQARAERREAAGLRGKAEWVGVDTRCSELLMLNFFVCREEFLRDLRALRDLCVAALILPSGFWLRLCSAELTR